MALGLNSIRLDNIGQSALQHRRRRRRHGVDKVDLSYLFVVGWVVAFKRYVPQEPQNVTWFGIRIFAHPLGKDCEMNSSWLMWALHPMTSVLIRHTSILQNSKKINFLCFTKFVVNFYGRFGKLIYDQSPTISKCQVPSVIWFNEKGESWLGGLV